MLRETMKTKDIDSERHIVTINRVIDFIEENLHEELSLDQIARCAGLSDSHFHKLFTQKMKETPGRFIQRLRIERAAALLVQFPVRTVTEIAFDCGFASSASFTRAFGEYFSVTPTQWRDPLVRTRVKSTRCQDALGSVNTPEADYRIQSHFERISAALSWTVYKDEKLFSNISIQTFPETEIAYVRHVGPYMMNPDLFRSLYLRLYSWAVPRKLVTSQTRLFNIYHDDPSITAKEHLRLSVGIEIAPGTRQNEGISILRIPGGDYAVASFEIGADEYVSAWSCLFSHWFAHSGYACGEGISFEIPLRDPADDPGGKHAINIYIPVVPCRA